MSYQPIRTVYFDTNVFDHIYKGIDIAESAQHLLRLAVETGRISILLSVLNFEEIMGLLEKSNAQAVAVLRLMAGLVEKNRIVKPSDMFLRDDIHRYAQGNELLAPFINLDPVIQSNLEVLTNPSQKDIDELLVIVKEVKKEKENFVLTMREANSKVLPHAKQFLKNNYGKPPNWKDYWESLAERFAEGFVEREKLLDACRNRGIKGLLALRSVRMTVGASLSLAYAETFEKRTPKMGDSRDMQHAVLATAADAFVTHDHNLARLLARIPIERFQVLDLPGLLHSIN